MSSITNTNNEINGDGPFGSLQSLVMATLSALGQDLASLNGKQKSTLTVLGCGKHFFVHLVFAMLTP